MCKYIHHIVSSKKQCPLLAGSSVQSHDMVFISRWSPPSCLGNVFLSTSCPCWFKSRNDWKLQNSDQMDLEMRLFCQRDHISRKSQSTLHTLTLNWILNLSFNTFFKFLAWIANTISSTVGHVSTNGLYWMVQDCFQKRMFDHSAHIFLSLSLLSLRN